MSLDGTAAGNDDRVRVLLYGRNAKGGGATTVLREVSAALGRMPSVDVAVLGPGASARGRVPGSTIAIGLSETIRLRGPPDRRIFLARNLKAWAPDTKTAKNRLRSVRARRNARRALMVVCASEYFAELVRSRVPEADVRVVRFGVDRHFVPDGRSRPGRYLLAVGNVRSHKCYPGLIRAFSSSAISRTARLVIAGAWPSARDLEAVKTGVADTAPDAHVELAGPLGPADLAQAYRGAVALVQWSTLESYCHPLVEATACGTPIVSRAIPVAKELVGGSALLVDDELALTDALESLEDEGVREALGAASLKRRATLARSWDDYCTELLSFVGEPLPT